MNPLVPLAQVVKRRNCPANLRRDQRPPISRAKFDQRRIIRSVRGLVGVQYANR
jgi:hypothetical protein